MNRMIDPLTSQAEPATAFEQSCRTAFTLPESPRPVAWQDVRQDAYVQFERLGLPTPKHEDWKYAQLRGLFNAPLVPLPLIDGQHLLQTHTPGCGLWVMPLAEAWADATLAPRLVNVLRPLLTTLQDPFALLALALATQGLVVHAPKGAGTEGVLDLTLHMPLQANAAFHGVIVVLADEQSNVRLRLKTTSQSTEVAEAKDTTSSTQLINLLTVAEVGAHAQFYGLHQQQIGQQTHLINAMVLHLASHAHAHFTTLDEGKGWARHNLMGHLNGSQAELTANALALANGQSHTHYVTHVHHHTSNAVSRQLVKGIVADQAHVDFAGTIWVDPNAHGTQAEQNNRHLVLSNQAKVTTRPQLRIDADDVRCTHGASIGQLDEESLFYLVSRGLTPQVAKAVLTEGFGAEVLQALPAGLCYVPRHTTRLMH
jgi:Fe-S cluster assembly protein SufD